MVYFGKTFLHKSNKQKGVLVLLLGGICEFCVKWLVSVWMSTMLEIHKMHQIVAKIKKFRGTVSWQRFSNFNMQNEHWGKHYKYFQAPIFQSLKFSFSRSGAMAQKFLLIVCIHSNVQGPPETAELTVNDPDVGLLEWMLSLILSVIIYFRISWLTQTCISWGKKHT